MNPRASLTLDRAQVECGGFVTGQVSWSANRAGKAVAVVLRYRTQGRGETDSGLVARADLGPAEFGQAQFRLDVPPGGPVTYNGNLVRVLWEVAVQIPAGKGAVVTRDLTVTPYGWSRVDPEG